MKRHLVRQIRRKLLQLMVGRVLVLRKDDELVRLGSAYGGWWIPANVLDRGATVVSAGVGEDTTFDEELIARGCEVWAVDPTPRAKQHVDRRNQASREFSDRFHFRPVGLWYRDEILRFYAPADPSHVSHSIVNAQATNSWFEAQCWSLPHLIQQIGLDSPVVLKLDIEGAEVEVLRAMCRSRLRPSVVCVEMDSPLPELRTLRLLREIRRAGYRLAHAERWNLLLVRE